MNLVRVPAILVACFVLGAFTATLVHSLSGRWRVPAILLLEALLLGLALALSFTHTPWLGDAEPLAVAMGAQNAALRSDQGHRIGGTFVTGTVFSLGEKLALWCLRRGGGRAALEHALGWFPLALGAASGTWAFAAYGPRALVVPAACILVLGTALGLLTLGARAGVTAEERADQPS